MTYKLSDEQRGVIFALVSATDAPGICDYINERLIPQIRCAARNEALEEADNLFNVYSTVQAIREGVRALKEKPLTPS